MVDGKITNGSLWGSITSAGKGRMSGEKKWAYSPRSRHLPASYSVATYIVLHISKDLACAVAFDAKFVMKTESSTKLCVLG